MNKIRAQSAAGRSRPDRRPISVRRWWGNGDVEATVKLTRPQWRRICAGETVDASTWSWYEGKRERVGFRFNHPERGDLSIGGNDGADHDHGTIAEAQITGAEFPPRQTHATEFTVREGGTLEMSGISPPETRGAAYDLAPNSIRDHADLLAAADACPPLSWHLDRELHAARSAGPKAAPSLSQPDAEAELAAWLESLSTDQLGAIIAGVHTWLNEEPDWVQEDDHLPLSADGQGAALNFFRSWRPEDRHALGIAIVEGEHPGSSYCAAVLDRKIREANLSAWLGRLPVWFSQG